MNKYLASFIGALIVLHSLSYAHAQEKTEKAFSGKESLTITDRTYTQPSITTPKQMPFPIADKVSANFKWSMPARYGLDANSNGLIDLPNSFSYVQNLRNCTCVRDPVDTFDPGVVARTDEMREGAQLTLDVPQDVFPSILQNYLVCEDGSPRFLVNLDASKTQFPRKKPFRSESSTTGRSEWINHEQLHAQYQSRMRALEWTIDGKPYALDPTGGDWRYQVCLTEGNHEVQLTATDHSTGETDTVSKVIRVEDFLFVTIGDSFASGEGNPERTLILPIEIIGIEEEYSALIPSLKTAAAQLLASRFRGVSARDDRVSVALWADDGTMPPPRTLNGTATIEDFLETIFGISGVASFPLSFNFQIENWPQFTGFGVRAREHDRAHRSTFSAASQAALKLEQRSDHSSVTFVNLAMSGATVESGLKGNFGGRRNSRFFDPNSDMLGQTEQLGRLVGNRNVDALYISAGGNDIGFANVLVGLLLHDRAADWRALSWREIEFGDIGRGVRTGDWHSVENSAGPFQDELLWNQERGLNKLNEAYDELCRALRKENIKVSHVYITEYPDLSGYTQPDGYAYWCDEVLRNVKAPLEIDTKELKWSVNKVLDPLNSTIRSSAERLDWTYIGGIKSMTAGHGLCARKPYDPLHNGPEHPVANRLGERMRWFRTGRAAYLLQAAESRAAAKGTAHPNEFGHYAIMTRLLEEMVTPESSNAIESPSVLTCN